MTKLVRLDDDPVAREARWRLSWEPVEAAIVLSLPAQLAALLAHPEGNRRVIDRLFPCAYADPREQEEHRRLLGASLLDARREMLSAIEALFAGATRGRTGTCTVVLDPRSIDLLMRFLNDVRLVLATDLGIETNLDQARVPPSHPDAARHALLDYLGHVQSILVDAAARDM